MRKFIRKIINKLFPCKCDSCYYNGICYTHHIGQQDRFCMTYKPLEKRK